MSKYGYFLVPWSTKIGLLRFSEMLWDTWTPSGIDGATSKYRAFFRTLILGASYRLGGTYGGIIVIDVDSSTSSRGVGAGAFFFQLLECFPVVVPNRPGRSGHNLTIGINGTCSIYSVAATCSGTYPVVSSIMRVGDAVAISDFATAIVLEIEITMLYGKLTPTLTLANNNISLECNKMNWNLGAKLITSKCSFSQSSTQARNQWKGSCHFHHMGWSFKWLLGKFYACHHSPVTLLVIILTIILLFSLGGPF